MLSLRQIGESERRAMDDIVFMCNQFSDKIKSELEALRVNEGFLLSAEVTRLRGAYENALAFIEAQKVAANLEQRFDVILCECDWPPLLDFTHRDIKAIVDEYDRTEFKQFRKDFDAALLECYGLDALAEKITSWQDKGLRPERLFILKKAVEAHSIGDFVLSVPVILVQIEGVIAEGMKHTGWMGGTRIRKYLETLANGYAVEPFSSSAMDFVNSTVLEQFEWGSPLSSSLSRHAILHGAATEYGTEVNSLKALLLFDFVVTSLYAKKLEAP